MAEFNDIATLFVPLVIGLVIQLSNVERGRDADLDEVADTDPFFLPSGSFVPQLGRLNFVHGTNLILLLGCYVLATELDAGLLRTLLVAFVLVVWLQLPVLEIKKYGSLLSGRGFPRSFDYHVATTLATAIYVWQFSGLSHFTASVNSTVLQPSDFLRNGAIALIGLSWFLFLRELQREIEDDSSDDRRPRLIP